MYAVNKPLFITDNFIVARFSLKSSETIAKRGDFARINEILARNKESIRFESNEISERTGYSANYLGKLRNRKGEAAY